MKAIRDRRGRWNLAVYINPAQFKAHADPTWDMFANARAIEALAQAHQVAVCGSPQEAGKSRAHSLFLVGHNLGISQPGILQDVYHLGRQLRGRYLALYCCGTPGDREEIHLLIQRTRAAQIHAAHMEISLWVVRRIFEKLVELVEQGGEWSPEQAIQAAERLVLQELGS